MEKLKSKLNLEATSCVWKNQQEQNVNMDFGDLNPGNPGVWLPWRRRGDDVDLWVENVGRKEKERKEERGINGGETTSSQPLKGWTDKYYRQGWGAAERCRLIEIILTSFPNLLRGKHAIRFINK